MCTHVCLGDPAECGVSGAEERQPRLIGAVVYWLSASLGSTSKKPRAKQLFVLKECYKIKEQSILSQAMHIAAFSACSTSRSQLLTYLDKCHEQQGYVRCAVHRGACSPVRQLSRPGYDRSSAPGPPCSSPCWLVGLQTYVLTISCHSVSCLGQTAAATESNNPVPHHACRFR